MRRFLEVHPRGFVGVGAFQGALRCLGGLVSTTCSSCGGFSFTGRRVIVFFSFFAPDLNFSVGMGDVGEGLECAPCQLASVCSQGPVFDPHAEAEVSVMSDGSVESSFSEPSVGDSSGRAPTWSPGHSSVESDESSSLPGVVLEEAFDGDDRCTSAPLHNQGWRDSHAESWVSEMGVFDVELLYYAGLPMCPVVPYAFRDRWAAVNAVVAEWHKRAGEGSAERACALKWFAVLHILLLRKPLRGSRGARRRRDTMEQRFLDFERGHYASLFGAAVADVRRLRASGGARRLDPCSSSGEGLGVRMQKLILGQRSLRRAARLLGGMTLASGQDADVAEQVIRKHPKRRLHFRLSPQLRCPMVALDMSELKAKYIRLDRASAVGPGGYRNSYLRALALAINDKGLAAHRYFANLFLNGKLPSWYYKLKVAVRVACLTDSNDTTSNRKVRPIALTCCQKRAWTSALMRQKSASLARFLQPYQVAVGIKGGAHLVAMAVNTHLALHPEHVVVSLDIRNAFNEGERALILQAVAEHESTRFLVPLLGAMFQPVSAVFGIAGLDTVSNGLQQGESTSTAVFAIAIHSALTKAAKCLARTGGMAVAYVDDAYFAGLPEEVAAAVEVFKIALAELHYELVPRKCEVMAVSVEAACAFETLRTDGRFPSVTSDTFQWGSIDFGSDAPRCVGDLHKCGLVVVGVPVGGQEFICKKLDLKVHEIVRQISKLRNSLQIVSRQNAFAILVNCLNVKFQYLLQSLPPTVTDSHCKYLDRCFLDAALDIMNVQLQDMNRWALIRLRLAGSKGGCGLISHQSIAKQARVATLVRSLPHLVGYTPAGPRAKRWKGILSLSEEERRLFELSEATYDPDRAGPRFGTLLRCNPAGLGEELASLWSQLQEAAGNPVNGALAQEADSIGMIEGKMVEGLQLKLTKQLQSKVFADLHGEALRMRQTSDLPSEPTKTGLWDQGGHVFNGSVDDVKVKFALVALQYTRHKTAQQVVTGKPGYDAATLVCSQDFVSIARLYLALPDLLAQDLLDNGVTTLPQGGNKSKEVDPFGCALASCSLARNKGINKRRHDEGAEFPVMALVMKYRYQMRSQPHNIFARFVSNRSKRSQYGAVGNAQALVPDTVDEERTSNGVGTLGDFKTKNNPLSALYEVGYSKADWNALESFQKKVHTGCVRKAYDADTKYNDCPRRRPRFAPGSGRSRPSTEAGPIQTECMRLGPVEGYIVGVFGGISSHLEQLLRHISQRAAERDYLSMGFRESAGAFSAILSRCYRVVGVAAQRSYAQLKARVYREALGASAAGSQWSKRRQERQLLRRERELVYATMAANMASVEVLDRWRGGW